MTTDNTDITPDPFDIDLQTLFAPVQPTAGFEDRLVAALQPRRRLFISPAIDRAALAAAALLAVGVTGYVGNRALTGDMKFAGDRNPQTVLNALASNAGPDVITPGVVDALNDAAKRGLTPPSSSPASAAETEKWDFGGGSRSAQNWATWNGATAANNNASYSYQNPFAGGKAVANGWQLKNPDASYRIAADIGPGNSAAAFMHGGTKTRKSESSSQYDGLDSILLPYAGSDVPTTPSPQSADHAIGHTIVPPPPAAALMPSDSVPTDSLGVAATIPVRQAQAHFDPTSFGPKMQGQDKSGQNQIGSGYHFMSGHIATHGVSADPADAASPSLSLQSASAENKTTSSPDESRPELQTANIMRNPKAIVAAGMLDVGEEEKKLSAAGQFELKEEVGEKQKMSTGANADHKANPILLAVPTATQPAVIDDRKIIRTGTMEFDVDRFDTAQMQITKIVLELGGFVGATDSTKLPNGKVRGSISVRVPPERLDVLVLSLRALGDLKAQQIVAQDISKQYTDVESELAADRAMQDRLLELIHNGKGAVKDLLAAENELGTWRAKIEKAEGMIRYYNGQVGLSTLVITLSEKDIQTPASAVETETADLGLEADDVEKARNSALKAIDDVKGRIIEAELKRFDAGQLAARLVADVPPESAGAVIDQLKQLGKVARLEINRQQSTSDGTAAVTNTTPLKTERKPTRLLISIYNLANVAPRRTTHVSLAAADVETAYTALIAAAKSNTGRIVTSNLDRGDPVKATGSLSLEFPPEKFDAAMAALRGQGDVLKLTLVENADTQNSTEAKTGLTVQLVSLASVSPREKVEQTLAAGDVPAAYQAVLDAVNAGHARVLSAQLNEADRQNITADLQLEVPRNSQSELDRAMAAAGGTISRTSTRSVEAEGTVDSKVLLHLAITSADHLPPRETTKMQVETADVDKAAADVKAAAAASGGRVLESAVSKDRGHGTARLILDLPLAKTSDMVQHLRSVGPVTGFDESQNPRAPAGPLAHGQIYLEFVTPANDAIVGDNTGPWASIRHGLSTSISGLLWSLQMVVVGLCLIGPWVAILWVARKVWKRRKTSVPAA